MNPFESIAARWPETNSRTAAERVAMTNLFELVDRCRTGAQQVRADHRLSSAGKVEKIRENLLKHQLLPALRTAQGALEKGRKRLDAWRAQLTTLPPVDKTDVAAAILRQEIRAAWRQLPISERLAMLGHSDGEVTKIANPDGSVTVVQESAGHRPDPLLLQAMFEVPAAFSGVPAEVRSRILDDMSSRLHPDATNDIEQDEADYGTLQAAIGVARGELVQLGEFENEVQTNAFLAS